MKTKTFSQLFLVLALGALMTATLQYYVGKPILYGPRQSYWGESTLKLHSAILTNKLSKGDTWISLGANSTNLRVGVIFLADWLHKISGKSLFSIYFWIDNAALTLNFVLLFYFLSLFFSAEWALSGTLFFYISQITTYYNHYFHPWDRLSLSFWIAVLYLGYAGKEIKYYSILGLLFFIGIFIKFDLICVTPVLFLFYWFSPGCRRKAGIPAILAVTGFTMLFGLALLRPGGSPLNYNSLVLYQQVVQGNFRYIKEYGLIYPPNLVFTLPVAIGIFGWKSMNLFVRVCFLLGTLALPAYFVSSWFHETRAEMPYFLLILPGTIEGLKKMLSVTTRSTPFESTIGQRPMQS